MLAHHLGARVDYCQSGSVEIGYHAVEQTEAGRVLGELPLLLYQWHREGFEVPRGATLLARSAGAFPNQAFGFGPAAIGVQFHPEITFAQVNRWSGSNPVRLLMRGARPRSEHMMLHLTQSPKVQRWLNQFLGRWVRAEVLPADERLAGAASIEFAKS
jgi:GMP synthase (glutamine-hydrolysing)